MKVYIFDMDGTFIDSMEFWDNLVLEYLFAKGIKADQNLPTELVSFTLREGIKYIKDKFDLKPSEEEIHKEMIDLLAYNYANVFDIEPSTIDIFKKLRDKGHKIVVATATQRSLTDIVMKRFDLNKWLDMLIVSDEIDIGKGNPQYFINIADHFGVKPENCVVAEDALYAIESAKEAGMKVVAITYQAQSAHLDRIKELSDIHGENLTEVKDYLLV